MKKQMKANKLKFHHVKFLNALIYLPSYGK
jgi:hypothetical protein